MPFETFRKHRTYWMAGLVLLAILAFIVAPGIESLMSFMQNNNSAGNKVVVRWSDGKVTLAALDATRRQHNHATRFLQALAREVVAAGGMPKIPGFRYDSTQKRVQDLGLPMLDTNRAVCQTMIISQRARQLGIDFDEAVIDDFFARFCDDRIDRETFQRILKETCGRELTMQALRRQLGLELSAVVMERIALAGVNYEGSPLVTPGSLWQNYLRLNQAARVEAFPVLTSEFIKEVKTSPTESEVRAIYEEGAGNFPSPNSPEPGFRRRYQAELEYVFGSWNKLIEVEKAKISPEALKAEYDRLVALGGLQVPIDPPKLPDSPATPDANKPAEGKPAEGDKPMTASKPEEGQPPAPGAEVKPEAPKPESDKPDAPKADAPKADPPQPDKPAEEPKPEPKADEPKAEKPAEDKPADPKSQSRLDKADSIRLVAFAQDNNQPPPVADPSAEPPAADKPTADKPAEPAPDKPAEPTAEQPADKPASDKPAEAPAATTPPADKPADKPADAAAAPATPDLGAAAGVASDKPGTMPMRTKTFEEAKEDVARTLAMNVVREQLQAKLGKIESEMNRYSSELQMERVAKENGVKPEAPVKPIDLKKLAEAEGLQYGSTGMSDGFRLASSTIGRSMIGNQSLVNTIMNPNVEIFRPVRSMFIDMGNATEPDFQEFVSWKTKDQAAYTPELSQLREEIVATWQGRQARKLANDQAEALAEKLRKGGADAWKSVLNTEQQSLVVNTTPFTWMSPPREMFAPAQITFVQGLDSVGNEFMQKVFSTPVGQFTVAPNAGLNTYYVIRVAELTPSVEELRQNFETSRGRARQLAFPERERMFSDWYQNIERKLNVQWVAADDMLMN